MPASVACGRSAPALPIAWTNFPTSRSLGRTSRPKRSRLRPTLRSAKITWVDEWAESDLAWELADTLGALLPDRDRAAIYATIGAGDSYTAITTLVHVSARSGYALPARLVNKLAEWLHAYTDSNDAARLVQSLNAVKRCSSQE